MPHADVHWKFLNTLLIRSTGFPFSLIKEFRFKKTCAHFEAMWEISQAIDKLAADIREHFRANFCVPSHVNRSPLNKIYSIIDDRRTIPTKYLPTENDRCFRLISSWNALLTQFDNLIQEGRKIFEEELGEMRHKLRNLLQNELFREAIFISSVGNSERVVKSYLNSMPNKPNFKTRQDERFFMNHLQRLCTKNETTSFFGPINFGKILGSNRENIKIQFRAGKNGKKIVRTEVFFANWATRELAQALSRDPAILPHITPRRHPFYTLSNERVYYFGIQEKHVTTEQLSILHLIDGKRQFKDIQNQLQLTEDQFWQASTGLAEEQIITNVVLISPYTENGVQDLLHFLSTIPSGNQNIWWQKLSQLEELREQFRDLPYSSRVQLLEQAERLFEEITGKKAKRGEGQFYTDRSIFFEDSQGVISHFEIGGELLKKLHLSLSGILDALSMFAIARWECWQILGREVLRRLSGNSMKVSFTEYFNEFEDLYQEIQASETFQQYQAVLEEAIHCFQEAVQDDGRINHELLLTQLSSLFKNAGLLRDLSYPLCACPDILIASKSLERLNKGEYTPYIGEIQPVYIMTYQSFMFFCSWEKEHLDQLRQILKELGKPQETLQAVLRREMKLFPAKVADHSLYLQEPCIDASDRFPIFIEDLDVVETNEMITLRHKKSGRLFVFPDHLTRDPRYEFLKIFSFPFIYIVPVLLPRKRMPKIMWNGIVYQRATWHVAEQDVACLMDTSGFELFWESFRLKKTLQLPDSVFVRNQQERKPFFVDFNNFFLVEILRHASRVLPEFWLSEFGPDEEELWLEIDREKYCSELRLGMYSQKT